MNLTETEDIRNRLLVARLPAMPQILLKLIELCQADDAGMTEIAKLIANDAGIASRVMHVANSAAYQRGGRKVGLVQALSTLGLDMIKTLVISESVFQTFNGFPHTSSTDLRGFWKHSLTAAVVARDLAKLIKYPQVEEAYLAGLLHDVGRLALLAVAPDVYRFNFQTPDTQDLCSLEQRSMHISHTEAGAWLIERWNLDSFLADSVLYHHEDASRINTAHPLIRIVHLAHLVSYQPVDTPLEAGTGQPCGVSDTDLLTIQQGAEAQVLKSAEYLGIDLSGIEELASAPPVVEPDVPANPLQQRITEQIRNRALTSELSQLFARQKGDTQLLDSVRQNARILFDLDNTVIFLTTNGGQSMVGASVGEQRQRLADFSVSLTQGGTLAECVLQRQLGFIQLGRGVLTMLEEQLIRAFSADCLVCLPIAIANRCVGLLVAGVERWRVTELQRQEKFLMAFGSQAATAIESAVRERDEINRQVTKVREEQLLNSRKVIHEANNPLSIIKNYLSVLDEKLTRKESVSGELSVLNEEIDRVGSIIKEFANDTSGSPSDSAFDINRVINDIVRLFRESKFLPPTVKIMSRMPDEPCEIAGSPDTLKQVFVNLIKNAVEALPQGGYIEIVNVGQTRHEGTDYFELSVRDSGPGMPQEVMAKLFTPVQSSKPGENRGLGLSIVHGLVKKLNGRIDCKSSRMGTTFEVLLPVKLVKSLV